MNLAGGGTQTFSPQTLAWDVALWTPDLLKCPFMLSCAWPPILGRPLADTHCRSPTHHRSLCFPVPPVFPWLVDQEGGDVAFCRPSRASPQDKEVKIAQTPLHFKHHSSPLMS